jgi:hypothetical protein
MRTLRFHEGHRRQGHRLSSSRHLQGGCSGHPCFATTRMERWHRDSQIVFISKASSFHRIFPPSRRLTHHHFTRVHQGADTPGNFDRVGRTRAGTYVSQFASASEARRITSTPTHRAIRRGDSASAFTEESLVGQMTLANKTIERIRAPRGCSMPGSTCAHLSPRR